MPGGNSAWALAVSADGSVIGGYGTVPGGSGTRAFIWTSSLGMVDLNDYLPSIGISTANWTLSRITGISSDGLTLVGTGFHEYAPGQITTEGFLVRIPAPGTLAILLVGTLCPARRRRRA